MHINPVELVVPYDHTLLLLGKNDTARADLPRATDALAKLQSLKQRAIPSYVVGASAPVVIEASEKLANDARCRAADALRQAHSLHSAPVSVILESNQSALIQRQLEGLLLAQHRFRSLSGIASERNPDPDKLNIILLSSLPEKTLTLLVENAKGVALACSSARDLATEPGNILTPDEFVQRCQTLAERHDLAIKVLGRTELEAQQMGGLLAVSAGSEQSPYLVRIDLPGHNNLEPIVIVGKTVTFDSGGISLKAPHDMERMKADMGGGAAAFGALHALANVARERPMSFIFPVVENMPGPAATRPGDVIRTASGTTVEIINTDAEGRLILADAFHYAQQLEPALIIDLATLTGATSGIFGPLGIAAFCNCDDTFDHLQQADMLADELVWRLPLWPEYREFLKSPVADCRNFSTTAQQGSTMIAAAFLQLFVGNHSWLHLDLYNTCWNTDSQHPLYPLGPTASGTRLITQLLLDLRHRNSLAAPHTNH